MSMKKPLIAAAAVSTVSLAGLGGVGVASAMTNESSNTNDVNNMSIVDRLSERFDLNRDEVRAIFEQDLKAEQSESRAELSTQLEAAVERGELSQEQADYILDLNADIDAMLSDVSGGEMSEEEKINLKAKISALNNWGNENDVDDELLGDGRLDVNVGVGVSLGILNNNDDRSLLAL